MPLPASGRVYYFIHQLLNTLKMKKLLALGMIALISYSQQLQSQDLSGTDPEVDLTFQDHNPITTAEDTSEYDRFLSEILMKVSDPSQPILFTDEDQCSVNELLLDTQAKVDTFDCTTFEGTIIIKGSGITNLDSLYSLTHVNGNLMIYLTSITDLSGLSNLNSVTERFALDGNNHLSALNSLSGLSSIGQGFYIHNSQQLTSLEGLSGLSYVKSLSIKKNPLLHDLTGFPDIPEIDGSLSISSNSGLINLDGLPGITIGELYIMDNPNLISVNALSDIQVEILFYIINNQQLTECQEICPFLQNYYSTHSRFDYFRPYIYNNGYGCSETEMLKNCGLDYCSGNTTFYNQHEVDCFDCEDFNGNLYVYGYYSGIENMDSLYNLKSVSGSFYINNSQLSDLNGLSGLKSVGEYLFISDNTQLQDVTGLNQLDSVGKSFMIQNNNQLESLDGISGIKTVEENLFITDNNNLKLCCDAYPLLASGVVKGNISINNNGSDCTKQSILNYCPLEYCSGNLLIDKQEQIDAFSCTSFKGSITITGEDITNLHGLSSLDSISGSLSIYSTKLSDLEGLDELSYIKGNLGIDNNDQLLYLHGLQQLQKIDGGLYINNNDVLKNMTGLISLMEVFKDVKIKGNKSLINLEGMSELSSVKSLTLDYNNKLVDLTGLDNLSTIKEFMEIGSNNQMRSLDGLNELRYINDYLNIHDNEILESIEGLSGIDSISDIMIMNNGQLESLKGLSNLTGFIKHVKIIGNKSLTQIDDLSGITSTLEISLHNNNQLTNINGLTNIESVSYLGITYNPQLSDIQGISHINTIDNLVIANNTNLYNCCDLYPLLISNVITGTVIIENNGAGCTKEDILINCVSEYCYGDIQLDTQKKVDAFGCSSFNGSITVIGEDISNLQGLSQLDSVKGSFRIYNTSLVNLKDLTELSYVGGNLGIDNNDQLLSLSGLDSLTYLKEGLFINNNDLITDLTGMSGITTINGDVRIFSNNQLINLNGLSSLTYVKKKLYIDGNDHMLSLEGMSNLTAIGGDFWIYQNDVLKSIDGLLGINYIGGWLAIHANPNLSDCCGIYSLKNSGINVSASNNGPGCTIEEIMVNCAPCSGSKILDTQEKIEMFNCTFFDGDLTITGEDIHDISNLSVLNSINGDLSIIGTSLENIETLSDLSYVGGSLFITDNNDLVKVNGLTALQSIGGDIEIYSNPSLERIEGLDSLTSLGGDFHIEENWELNSIDELSGLELINGSLSIENSTIKKLDGFSNLKSITGDLILNNGIKDIKCFQNLEYVGGNLNLEKNHSLPGIDGFNSLKEIGGDLTIHLNDYVYSLLGFDELIKVNGNLHVSENYSLIQYCGLYNILASKGVEGDISVFNTGINFCTVDSVLLNCSDLSPCSGDLSINSLEKLESFDCSTYDGSIRINAIGYNIDDLHALSVLDSITGDLGIYETQIEDFSGLENLTYIGGSLRLTFNFQLNSLKGLSGLKTVGGDIGIDYNHIVSDCCPIYPFLSSGGLSGYFYVYGCSQEDILANCGDEFLRYSNEDMYDIYDLADFEESMVYPNPLNDNYLNIKWKSDASCSGTLRILNLNGKEIYHYQVNLKEGVNHIRSDVSKIDNGAYILSLEHDNKIEYVKLIKSN